MIKIFIYTYVRANLKTAFTDSNYKELIDQYSQEGWRFTASIPTVFGGYGQTKEVDLVFEKQK